MSAERGGTGTVLYRSQRIVQKLIYRPDSWRPLLYTACGWTLRRPMCALQILMHFERCVRSTGHVRPESIPCAHDLAMSCALARSGWSKLRPGTHPCGHVAAVCGCVSGAWWGTPHAGCWLKCLRWKKMISNKNRTTRIFTVQ